MQYILNGSPPPFVLQYGLSPLEHVYCSQSESLLQLVLGGGVSIGVALVVAGGGGGGGGGGASVGGGLVVVGFRGQESYMNS